MKLTPVDCVKGEIVAPQSKAYTHRAYFIALLADGISEISNPLRSDDTMATVDAIKAFGGLVYGNKVAGGTVVPGKIFARASGTTARFSIGVAALADGVSYIDGVQSLRRRPMDTIVRALKKLGIKISNNYLPMKIEGNHKLLEGKRVKIDGSKTSQAISALLIVAAKVGMELTVINPVSKPYIFMTLKVLESFGIDYEQEEEFKFTVSPGIKPSKYSIPGDYSSASFFLAAGALYGKVRVKNLDPGDVQTDKAVLGILKHFGAKVRIGENWVEVEKGELKGQNLDLTDAPDLFPVLSVVAAYSHGRSSLRAPQLRWKESDRIKAVAENLARMGIRVKELPDGLVIEGGKPKGAVINPHGDHRIAMAFAIAALGAIGETRILNPECVSKSYPNFFKDLGGLTK